MKRARIKKLIYEIYEDPSHKEDPSADCIDDHPLSQSRTDKNGKENRAVFLGQTWSPTITGQQGFTSISDAEKGIGISILRNSPQRDRHCTRDPEFIFREQCQQETSPGAFSDIRYQQVTACYQKGILSPIEVIISLCTDGKLVILTIILIKRFKIVKKYHNYLEILDLSRCLPCELFYVYSTCNV